MNYLSTTLANHKRTGNDDGESSSESLTRELQARRKGCTDLTSERVMKSLIWEAVERGPEMQCDMLKIEWVNRLILNSPTLGTNKYRCNLAHWVASHLCPHERLQPLTTSTIQISCLKIDGVFLFFSAAE